ncbi:MAG TPA: ribosome biogenesis GTPase YlqF, partial [Firmicutes bacterium]|nr:ribosome biogenesis GTPase YlqF [Bacillota bacterium]
MSMQWYPGHMAKVRRELLHLLKGVDVVVETLDARIPAASRNPDLNELLGEAARAVALNKADLADRAKTQRWVEYLGVQGPAVATDAQTGAGIRELLAGVQDLARERLAAWMAKGRRRRPVRVMVVGIPNVGKSSVINRMAGRSGAKTGNVPGVTRGPQWLRVGQELELLDTPGLLWPKLGDPEVGFALAVTGAIDDRLFRMEEVALHLLARLEKVAPGAVATRYEVDMATLSDLTAMLQAIGRRRGCLAAGGRVDLERAAAMVLNDFRKGRL